MYEYSSLNQIKLISNSTKLSTELDIELLILNLLSIDKNILYRDDPRLSSEKLKELKELVQRREKGEPLAYLVKGIGFWSLDLYVDENVLVPRPETEIIVEKVLEDFNASEKKVLDLGTGSGAIGLSLSKERVGWEIYCSDKSYKALQVASKNMQSNSLNVSFIHSAAKLIDGDGIVTGMHNPNYQTLMSGTDYFKRWSERDMLPVCPSAIYNRSSLIESGGFSSKFPYTADIMCFISLARLSLPSIAIAAVSAARAC